MKKTFCFLALPNKVLSQSKHRRDPKDLLDRSLQRRMYLCLKNFLCEKCICLPYISIYKINLYIIDARNALLLVSRLPGEWRTMNSLTTIRRGDATYVSQ